jgi:CheY-like chemotaxis protein
MLVEQILARRPDLRLLTAVDAEHGLPIALAVLPDVILLDINLPGRDGYDILAHLRADPSTRPIPVLAVSANAMPADLRRGLDAGFFRYLTKPIRVDAFLDALEDALAEAGQGRQDPLKEGPSR